MKTVSLMKNSRGEATNAILEARHPRYGGYGLPASIIAFQDVLDFWFKGEEKTPPPMDASRPDKRWQDTAGQHTGNDAVMTFVMPARNPDGSFMRLPWDRALLSTGWLTPEGATFYRIYERHPAFRGGVPALAAVTMTVAEAMAVNFNPAGKFVDYPVASWVGLPSDGGWTLAGRGLMFDANGLPVLFDMAEFQRENPRDQWVGGGGGGGAASTPYTPAQAV